MNIDVEPKDLGKVVQLVAKNDGWTREHTLFQIDRTSYIGGNPNADFNKTPESLASSLLQAWLTTRELRPNDFNGSKVAVSRLAVIEGLLVVTGVTTDYFTLWGLPKTDATKELFKDHEREIVINRVIPPTAVYATQLPWGACSHNTLLDRNGDILMMVRSLSQGFNAGRVSVTEEEQTEPTDSSVFATSARSFKEELNLEIPQRRVRLLGVAMEKNAAYAAFAYITQTDILATDLVKKWKRAKDYNENTALFVVPMTQVDKWTNTHDVTSDIWGQHLLAGDIAPDATLRLHATSPWRIDLAKKYSYLAK